MTKGAWAINHVMEFKHENDEARGRNGEFKPKTAFATKYSNDWVSIRVVSKRKSGNAPIMLFIPVEEARELAETITRACESQGDVTVRYKL